MLREQIIYSLTNLLLMNTYNSIILVQTYQKIRTFSSQFMLRKQILFTHTISNVNPIYIRKRITKIKKVNFKRCLTCSQHAAGKKEKVDRS